MTMRLLKLTPLFAAGALALLLTLPAAAQVYYTFLRYEQGCPLQ